MLEEKPERLAQHSLNIKDICKMSKLKTRMHGTKERPRLVVFKSLKYIYGQLIDDDQRKVIISASNVGKKLPKNIKEAKTKVDASKEVGKTLGTLAVNSKIKEVIFDRNGYLYHGRVKAFADGAREGGLKF
jgi:large subunit ribosomal protein L18